MLASGSDQMPPTDRSMVFHLFGQLTYRGPIRDGGLRSKGTSGKARVAYNELSAGIYICNIINVQISEIWFIKLSAILKIAN